MFVLSVASGLLAASSTLFAKLLASSETHIWFLPESSLLHWIHPKAVLLPLVIASNIGMWAVFTRALNSSSSSVAVTVLNSSSNMIASALLGYFLFDENLSVRWWIGACFVLAGSALMNNSSINKNDELTSKQEEYMIKTRSSTRNNKPKQT
ncbi:hypothetical protein BDR26DRAFT_849283 [Obelidium mucronatum]|nr:hypothetical protein BDR26DRAFT_849283 [Obelidium mucronatum]